MRTQPRIQKLRLTGSFSQLMSQNSLARSTKRSRSARRRRMQPQRQPLGPQRHHSAQSNGKIGGGADAIGAPDNEATRVARGTPQHLRSAHRHVARSTHAGLCQPLGSVASARLVATPAPELCRAELLQSKPRGACSSAEDPHACTSSGRTLTFEAGKSKPSFLQELIAQAAHHGDWELPRRIAAGVACVCLTVGCEGDGSFLSVTAQPGRHLGLLNKAAPQSAQVLGAGFQDIFWQAVILSRRLPMDSGSNPARDMGRSLLDITVTCAKRPTVSTGTCTREALSLSLSLSRPRYRCVPLCNYARCEHI